MQPQVFPSLCTGLAAHSVPNGAKNRDEPFPAIDFGIIHPTKPQWKPLQGLFSVPDRSTTFGRGLPFSEPQFPHVYNELLAPVPASAEHL